MSLRLFQDAPRINNTVRLLLNVLLFSVQMLLFQYLKKGMGKA